MKKIDAVKLSQELIRCPSVTPEDAGALDVLQKALESLGFKCQRKIFSDKNTPDVDNLYARLGTKGKNFCFAGHTDVVPVGDAKGWSVDPFAAEIKDGKLIGRGAADMKCAIAAFVSAVSEFLLMSSSGLTRGSINIKKMDSRLKAENDTAFFGSISLLITGDEEGPSINGTRKMLKFIKGKGQKIDACIVGEPTNQKKLGDMVKIGRRGSVNFILTVKGVQGHAAYPHLADNPVPKLLKILSALTAKPLDKGSRHFDPSNLEITSVDVGNSAANVIPAQATAKFNIRFNDKHTAKSLHAHVKKACSAVTKNYIMQIQESGGAFYTKPGKLSDVVSQAVKKVTRITPMLSTSGGTSDARFIKDYCPVVEFGLINQTAHKVNEFARVEDIEKLRDIYLQVLKSYF